MSAHEGHRHRLIQKLDSGTLCEHEYLEALLFNAIPRMNTNELAHRLIARFGSVRGVFDASVAQLMRVEGIGESVAAYLFCIGKFYRVYREPEKPQFPLRYDPDEFIEFVSEHYAKIKTEVLDFYLLDESQKILICKSFSTKELKRVVVHPEELTRLILDFKPYGLVAVHNHLTQSCRPSAADDDTTCEIQILCSYHNVLFCDHFIYSSAGVYSYYRSRKLEEISKKYSVPNIVRGGGRHG